MNWKVIITIVVVILLCGFTNHGGVGTFQGVLSEDGKILAVVDTRTGGYKIRRITVGDYVEQLFNAKERSIPNYKYEYYESD